MPGQSGVNQRPGVVTAQSERTGGRSTVSPHHVLPDFAVPKDQLAAEPAVSRGPACAHGLDLPLLQLGSASSQHGMAGVIKRKIVAFKELIFEAY